MKIEFTKEWCHKMALLEGDLEIGAGVYAADPTFDSPTSKSDDARKESNVVFGRFVKLMRRRHGLTIETLANDINVDIADLVGIEDDAKFKPEPRVVHQIATFFEVPESRLMEVAGLTTPKNDMLISEAFRFAARSDSVAELTTEEKAALEAFVSVLCKES